MLGNLGLITMLKRVRDQMQFYGDLHMEKTPPQLEKAAVNYKFVAEINATLLAAAEPQMFAKSSNQNLPPNAVPQINREAIEEAIEKAWPSDVGVNRI